MYRLFGVRGFPLRNKSLGRKVVGYQDVDQASFQRAPDGSELAFPTGNADGALEKQKRFWHWKDDRNLAAAGREETVSHEASGGAKTQAADGGQEGFGKKVERRTHRVVRAAADRDCRVSLGPEQRRQNRLEDEHGTAGGPDIEVKVATTDAHRDKDKICRVELGAAHVGLSDLLCRHNGGQVLAAQAGFGPALANVRNVKRFARQRRKPERRAQDLAAAFAKCPVDLDHCPKYSVRVARQVPARQFELLQKAARSSKQHIASLRTARNSAKATFGLKSQGRTNRFCVLKWVSEAKRNTRILL